MEARAIYRYARIAPRKAAIVADLIRGKDTKTAEGILMATPKAASELLIKILRSAVANAENNHGMDADNLYVAEVLADPGPIIKRYQPRAKGRAFPIKKRTSHLTIVVKEKV